MNGKVLQLPTPEGLAHVTRRVPCPECEGRGFTYSDELGLDECGCCDDECTVSAATWVPAPGPWKVGDTVAVVVERCDECRAGDGWVNDLARGFLAPCPNHQRRQVIAATADTTEALPVVANNDFHALAPYVRIMRDGKLCVRLRDGGAPDGYYDPGPFLWEPGQTALRLTDVTELDPPVSEMVCPTRCRIGDYCARCGMIGRVPLRVVDGDEVTW